MTHEMRYRIADLKRRRKLRKYTRVSDPTDLAAELGAARLMTQDAIESGQTALANLLLATIGKLSHSQIAAKRASEEYIPRSVVRQLVSSICEIVAKSLETRGVENWEEILDEISAQLSAAVEPKETVYE